jgi:hypothetical protein
LSHRRFDADRHARDVGKTFDEVEHTVDVMKRAMRRRTEAVGAARDATNLGNLGGDLGRRQDRQPRLMASTAGAESEP